MNHPETAAYFWAIFFGLMSVLYLHDKWRNR